MKASLQRTRIWGRAVATCATPRATYRAWAEVFVPGVGWITFDPTNRGVCGANLVPVAVAREIGQTIPVAGTYGGEVGLLDEMAVEVSVTSWDNSS